MVKQAKRDEFRSAVLRQWENWARQNRIANKVTGNKGREFFAYLQREESDLLEFKNTGPDPWQTIHSWLLSAGKVSD